MNTRSNKIFSILLLLAGTLLVGFSLARYSAPLAAWIGPVLMMRYARDHKGWRCYPLIIAAYTLAFLIGFWEIQPLPLQAFIVVGYGVLWSLPYLADRLMGARKEGFESTLVYPLAATTLEFVNIHTNPLGTWGAAGFTQYGNLPLMQLASVTGMIGITFLMGWFASVVNWAWENRSRGDAMLRGLVAFGAVLAAVYIFGSLRLNLAPATETVRVAGVIPQSGFPLLVKTWEMSDRTALRLEVQSHWDTYFAATVREAQAGAQVIIWPEGAGTVPFSDEAAFIAQAQEVARENGIYLAMGVFGTDLDKQRRQENKFMLIDPTGAVVIDHLKYGGNILEGTVRGNGKLQTAATPFGILSGIVCWDLDFPAVIQQAGRNGTAIMLVPSRDWLAIDPVHAQMAVFRAIENGMSIVRQTDDGLSIAVDPYGRVLAQTDFFGSTDHTLVAQVPVGHVATIYTVFGRWFEWICLFGFLVIVARALMARRKIS